MAKPLKIFLWIVGSFLALFALAAIALPLIIDPNNYRGQIEEKVEQQTGRQLKIIGDIDLKIFPWLGVRLGEVEMSNAKGFDQRPFARIQEAGVSVKLLPLLDKEVYLDTVYLRGLELNLAKNADGSSNWADLAADAKATTAADTAESDAETAADDAAAEAAMSGQGGADEQELALKSLDVAAVEITESALRFEDRQTGSSYKIENITLKTGALKRAEPININLSFVMDSSQPAVRAEVDLVAQAVAEMQDSNFELRKLSLNTMLSGAAVPNGKQQVTVTGDLGFNKNNGTAKLSNGLVQAAGLNLSLELDANGLDKQTPEFGGRINLKPFSPRALLGELGMEAPKTADNSALTKAHLNARLQGTGSQISVRDLDVLLDDSQLKGSLEIRELATQLVHFDLNLDQMDVDRYLPPKAEQEKDAAEPEAGDSINDIQIPTEALNALNAKGTVKAQSIKINGLDFSKVVLTIDALQGKPVVQNLKSDFYGGSIDETVTISQRDSKEPQIRTQAKLNGIKAGPMLQALLGKDHVTGLTSMSLDLTGRGQTIGALRQSLNGSLSASAENGAVKGFNLAQKLRSAKAKLRGETLQDSEAEETDFARMAATATIVNGVLQSNDLDAKNPLLRLTGEGQVDLYRETINYLAKPTVVETSKGQGGKDLEELRGLTIPIRITGNWADPKVKLDLEGALKDKAKAQLKEKEDEVKEKLKDKEDELKEKLRNKLGDFLKQKS